ncbi:MAG: hypothetical protein K0S34_343 [Bacillales bacterium]|jgi:hypothetical protein|nr:hypothetical protein [Bacillales bacterium]
MPKSFRKDRMKLANSYTLYYGHGRGNELALFDIAIIDSKGHTSDEINKLKLQNTLVITYLSIFEVSPHEPIFKELTEEDFWIVDGEPVKNKAYGTYLVSLNSKKWLNYLLHEVKRQLVVLETDGIFLDTIGDIENYGLPYNLRQQQLKGVVNFLYALKMLYPNHLFIQNNGLEEVCLHTAMYIDGICWENPPFNLNESEEWVKVITNRLLKLKLDFDIQIFLLLEESIEKERNSYEKAKKVARKHGFLLYNAPGRYVDGINLAK